MKKVTFGGKRPSAPPANDVDSWVANQTGQEPMKRLTIDVPISLHKRIKSRCAMQDLVMADVIRDLLQQRFPPEAEQGGAS